MKRALATIEVPSVLEPVGLCHSDGKGPDGMSIVPGKRGKALVWDVTVWNIFAPSYSGHAADDAASVANLAEAAKRRQYSELADAHHFILIGIDSLNVFRELGFHTKKLTGDPQLLYHKFVNGSVYKTIERFNCSSIISSSRYAMDLLLDCFIYIYIIFTLLVVLYYFLSL